MNLKSNSILSRQRGFTFIEVIIATMMLMLVVGAILQYFSTSGASRNQVYDLKAVAALKSESEKLEAFFKKAIYVREFDTTAPPDDIFLFKYDSDSGNIDIPNPNIHRVYYGNYEANGLTISIDNNNSIDNYHTYYEEEFDDRYALLDANQKEIRDLRTYTYCTFENGESGEPYTDYDINNLEMDVCMVVIDDMGSPNDPEDDLLGYLGWWVEEEGTTSKILIITMALQYWYPGADWKSVDPEVIVLETTVF